MRHRPHHVTASLTRVVRFHTVGGPEVLKLEDVEVGAPESGEVRVRVAACGLNRAETLYRAGKYIDKPVFPSLIGYEASGIVEVVGSGVKGIAAGQRVSILPTFSMAEYGVYGEAAIVPASSLAPVPTKLSMMAAAAVWMPLITSYGALVADADIGAGDAVVLTAGSSSVALMAMQIARHQGAMAILATRTAEKKEALLAAGAEHVIVTSEQDLAAEVLRITGGSGAKLIFDPVGGPFLDTLAKAVRPGGRILVYGGLSGEPAPFRLFPPQPGGTPLPNGATCRFYTLRQVLHDPQRFAAAKAYILDGFESGAFHAVIDRVFELDEAAAAHRYLESNAQVGKIMLRSDSSIPSPVPETNKR